MDTTFYEDSRFRGKEDIRAMKRPMTLDLDSVKSSKKPKVNSLLTSPDLNMLKIGSPELERLIIAQHGLVAQPPPNSCMYPKNDERDHHYSDNLPSLSHSSAANIMYDQSQSDINTMVPVSNSSVCNMMPSSVEDSFGYQPPISTAANPIVTSNCYAPVTNSYYGLPAEPLVTIKEEPQTVPCMGTSPPQSPIDMEDQERLKLERKRLRNRIAASKCRRRKLERIARLEDKVALLKSENTELTNHVTKLRDQVCQLKQQVMDHVRSGCEILVSCPYQEDL